jgi:two-component system CheB/CheR fusion protein
LGDRTSYWNADQAAAFTQLMLGKTQQYGVIFYDTALRITGWSEGAHFITGWTADEVLGQPTGMLFVPEDRERRLDEHEANTVKVVGVGEDERWHLRKDGSRFWSSGVSIALTAEDGRPTGFVKIFRDVTHLRARMKYLENVQHESSVRQHEQNIFIGTIAHEMRNPLSPLKTALEIMKRQQGDQPRHFHPIKVMDRQIGFLERLIEDLVDLTRVQTGRLSMAYETVVLQELLFEALEACSTAVASKGITVRQAMPPVPIRVEVDSRRLLQVVGNLLNNAVKYTPAGGNIWLTTTVDQTHFICYVKDDGQGISAELLPKIFDMFTQADPAHAERGAGLGIGLSVVKEIVSLHQGTIEVRSEGSGNGSEFIVRIPQRPPQGSAPEPSLQPRPDGS